VVEASMMGDKTVFPKSHTYDDDDDDDDEEEEEEEDSMVPLVEEPAVVGDEPVFPKMRGVPELAFAMLEKRMKSV
jgi:hypothetical protein